MVEQEVIELDQTKKALKRGASIIAAGALIRKWVDAGYRYAQLGARRVGLTGHNRETAIAAVIVFGLDKFALLLAAHGVV